MKASQEQLQPKILIFLLFLQLCTQRLELNNHMYIKRKGLEKEEEIRENSGQQQKKRGEITVTN